MIEKLEEDPIDSQLHKSARKYSVASSIKLAYDCSVTPGWLSDYDSGGYSNTTL